MFRDPTQPFSCYRREAMAAAADEKPAVAVDFL